MYSTLCERFNFFLFAAYFSIGIAQFSPLQMNIFSSKDNHLHNDACSGIPGLVEDQIQLCRNNPFVLISVGYGMRRAFGECQMQFQWERWNCSISRQDKLLSKAVMERGTKESGFVFAITSAGVVHAVTQACSAGNLTECTCDNSNKAYQRYSLKNTGEKFQWGGCSDNVRYGIWFGEIFTDAADRKMERILSTNISRIPRIEWQRRTVEFKTMVKMLARTRMNLHNNAVGRTAVEKQMTLKCRCHGVSGSCTMKTCWMALPNFEKIGGWLKQRHDNAVHVTPRGRKKNLRRRDRRKRRIAVQTDELVFIHKSPNFCNRNRAKGIIGTQNRPCNKNDPGSKNCNILCCGRGYNKQVVRVAKRCQCKFYWCCHVKCKTCHYAEERYSCK